jgi:hypothetical protein
MRDIICQLEAMTPGFPHPAAQELEGFVSLECRVSKFLMN